MMMIIVFYKNYNCGKGDCINDEYCIINIVYLIMIIQNLINNNCKITNKMLKVSSQVLL